jgi:hypothetical protein
MQLESDETSGTREGWDSSSEFVGVESESDKSGELAHRGWDGPIEEVLVERQCSDLDTSELGELSSELVLVNGEVLEEIQLDEGCWKCSSEGIGSQSNCSGPSETRDSIRDVPNQTKFVHDELSDVSDRVADNSGERRGTSVDEVARVLSPGFANSEILDVGGFVEITEEVLLTEFAGANKLARGWGSAPAASARDRGARGLVEHHGAARAHAVASGRADANDLGAVHASVTNPAACQSNRDVLLSTIEAVVVNGQEAVDVVVLETDREGARESVLGQVDRVEAGEGVEDFGEGTVEGVVLEREPDEVGEGGDLDGEGTREVVGVEVEGDEVVGQSDGRRDGSGEAQVGKNDALDEEGVVADDTGEWLVARRRPATRIAPRSLGPDVGPLEQVAEEGGVVSWAAGKSLALATTPAALGLSPADLGSGDDVAALAVAVACGCALGVDELEAVETVEGDRARGQDGVRWDVGGTVVDAVVLEEQRLQCCEGRE